MSTPPFSSYAQNGEDVVLWRALGSVPRGRYVEVGANDPSIDSISRAFYDAGWRGLCIEPVAALAERYRAERPGDTVVEAAITDADTDTVVLHQIDGTGLSTLDEAVVVGHQQSGLQVHDVKVPAKRLDAVLDEAGWSGLDIHFMVVDVEGAEASALASLDLTTWRPWVLVIESTRPRTTEPTQHEWEHLVLGAGYQFSLFDGLSRFYVADEHVALLGPLLSYPACVHDNYTDHHYRSLEADRDAVAQDNVRLRRQVESLVSAVVRWRRAAWEAAVAEPPAPVDDWAKQELEATRATLSWRITKPLRAVRGAGVRRPG